MGETGVIAMRFRNVWIDSVWLPTLSYTMARRAYQEWLEAVPSNRIMWGSDSGEPKRICIESRAFLLMIIRLMPPNHNPSTQT